MNNNFYQPFLLGKYFTFQNATDPDQCGPEVG